MPCSDSGCGLKQDSGINDDVPKSGLPPDGQDKARDETPKPVAPKKNAEITYAKVEGGWKPEWNLFLADALDDLGEDLISGEKVKDLKNICPRYKEGSGEAKKAVWVLIFASIAKFESNFDPNTVFNEPPPLNNQSVGLLQLSYGDEAHKGCPISKAKKNVADPKTNLTCGVAIMRNQIAKRGTLFTSKHYYWSVLTNKKTQITQHFNKYKNQIPDGC